MSKSTPLSQLNQNQAQGPSEEEKESLLVNEILNEINKDEEGENVSMNVENTPVQDAPVQAPPQPEVQPIPPSENNVMEEVESPEEAAKRMFNVDMEQPEETTMIQEFLNNLKAPIIVGALVVLFSIPQVTTTLGGLIPPREILQKFKLPVVLLMKFILSAVVYFAINMAL